MTDNATRAEAHTLIGAYALDAVSDVERRVFEEHLAHCPTCVQETAELRETTALLAGAATVEPPAHLRDRVLTAITDIRQLPPETERVETGGAAQTVPTGPEPSLTPGIPGRTRWLRGTAAFAAAASIAVAVTLGIQGVDTNQRLEQDLRALEQVNVHNGRIADLLAAPDAKLVRGEVAGGGTGTVVASAAEGEVLFLAQGLPPLPEDRTYQMWLIGADGPRPAGLLTSSDGQTDPVLASGFTGREAVGLTVEPKGGSARPTTPTVVVLPLV
ncbi:anti-sigma factor domain-containing protein [Saccharothrix saharensis]|uniref:anti-sigma factor n=1 Tax=Saccharothrix saharensis TaxID=571190 RepID=UPI0036AB8B0D